MRVFGFSARLVVLLSLACIGAIAQPQSCPGRPGGGSTITDPIVLRSENGVLRINLTMFNSVAPDGSMEYCYVYRDGSEAPTLMVDPGDMLIFTLTNHLTDSTSHGTAMTHGSGGHPSTAPCDGGPMTVTSTNVHFHGLNVPPKCHQDDVIKTLIQPSDPPFEYRIRIPENEPPGLYWYHPHPHGFTTTQIVGGASGALIVGGIENIRPEVAGLPQRVFVIRQKPLNQGDESTLLSVNFVPAFSDFPASIVLKPGEKQFWRVVNASSISFVRLRIDVGIQAQKVKLIAMDAVPLENPVDVDTVVIPPAGRAEFIIQGPPLGSGAQLFDLGFDTGPNGDPNPVALLAFIVPSDEAPEPPVRLPSASQKAELRRFAGLLKQPPTRERRLYFSESDDGTKFFITVAGQTPKVYDPFDPPAITTKQGAIEDWIIENRSTEVHAFHMHQIHFLVLEINGQPAQGATLRDTITIPYWDGVSSRYPSVKVRMDFRDPEIVGTFLYHCHILDHEDGGMMAKIKVIPAD
jgi:FtsP/CotA-like multicopper oxidase with cupredoxin domain